jgi:LysR family cyn operon transcriptional activator
VELTPLKYFRALARCGHMTQAARQLGVTQPALSAMLKKLEREVGSDLVHRVGRGIELSEAGRLFLVYAEETIRTAEAGVKAVRELAGLERGSIRVGGGATATTYLLPRVVSTVRRAHPGLRFYVREAGSGAVASAVASGELDLGIVTLPVEASREEELIAIPLVEDELRLITPPRYRLTESFHWKDLASAAVVGFEAGTAVRELIDRAAAAEGVRLNIVMELRSIESIKSMVAAGIGVGFVSRFALREGEGLACKDQSLSRRLAIIRRQDREPSAAVAEFEGVLKELVRD